MLTKHIFVHLISIFLTAGSGPNRQSEGNQTPLMDALFLRSTEEQKSVQFVRVLLKDGRADPAPRNSFPHPGLHGRTNPKVYCTKNSHIKILT